VASTGIPSIDALFSGEPEAALGADRESVGAVQALLIGHGFRTLPTLLAGSYGIFGPQTTAAVRGFQSANALPVSGVVDVATLAALVRVPAANPLVSRAYSALVLDVPFTGLLSLGAVTMQFEGGGYFCAANLNSDGCGLSFGLIQWAQRPGRLHELLLAWQRTDSALFTSLLGDGDQALVDALVGHTAQPHGGLDPATGHTTDPMFDLVSEPWTSRFQTAGCVPVFQRTQLAETVKGITTSARRIQTMVPLVTSERGLAFMLDLANQFGDGGAHSIAEAVASPGMTEADFLLAVQTESVARVSRQYGASSAEARAALNRRQVIRATPWLSDSSMTAM
jgi:hypothetical protein